MKKYKVIKVGYEQYNLVNVENNEDWHWIAEDQSFKEGEEVTEDSFIIKECMFVDDQGYGKAPFVFNKE